MKYFFFILIFFIGIWIFIFEMEKKENKFLFCDDYKKIASIYYFDIHKDIPLSVKQELLEEYETTSSLKITKCNAPEESNSLGIIQINANKESIFYKIRNYLHNEFDIYGENNFRSKYYKENKNYTHSFYYNSSFNTIIESNSNRIQNIHVLDTRYYMNIEILNNLEENPLEDIKRSKYKDSNEIFNIKLYYSNFATKKIEKTKERILKYKFNNLKLELEKDNKYAVESDKKIKIRSTKINFSNNNEYLFILNYLSENMGINTEDTFKYLENNTNLSFGLSQEKILIEVFYDDIDKIFEIKFLNI
jgi:hypothetical protein